MNDEPRTPRPPIWVGVVLTIVSVGALVWLISRDTESLAPFGEVAATEVIAIFALQLAYLVVESYRMQIVIEASSGVSLEPVAWFRIFVTGRLLNMIVPQSGNVYRAVRLKRDHRVPYISFGGALGAFLWLSVTLNLVVASILIALNSPELDAGPVPGWVALLAAALAAAIGPLAVWFLVRDRGGSGRLGFVVTTLAAVLDASVAAVRDGALLVKFALVWLVTIIVVVFLYGTVLSVVGADLGAGELIALYALVQVTSFVVITPGNLGIQEVGFAALATLLGATAAQGAAAAAIIRITGTIALAVPAVLTGLGDLRSALRGRDPDQDPSDGATDAEAS